VRSKNLIPESHHCISRGAPPLPHLRCRGHEAGHFEHLRFYANLVFAYQFKTIPKTAFSRDAFPCLRHDTEFLSAPRSRNPRRVLERPTMTYSIIVAGIGNSMKRGATRSDSPQTKRLRSIKNGRRPAQRCPDGLSGLAKSRPKSSSARDGQT